MGYEKTTIRAIADKVGITHGSIMSHYNSKVEIAVQVVFRYIQGLQQKCAEIYPKLPTSGVEDEAYYREMLWWTLHFRLLSDNPAFREFYVKFNHEGPIALAEIFSLQPTPPFGQRRIAVNRAEEFVTMSLVTAVDTNLAHLIGFGMIDFVQAALLIIKHSIAVGYIDLAVPTEQAIRSFAEQYVADIKIDVLNELLLKDD